MTKRECLMYVKENLIDTVADAEIHDELVAWVDKEIVALEKKAASAKTYAAKKRAENDAMTDAIVSVLTGEFQTIEAITAQIDGEDVTKAKVQARLTKLFKAGTVVKDTVNAAAEGEKKRMVVAYAIPACEA